MERSDKKTTLEEKDRRLQWKKTGRGSLRLLGRIIKPGETFLALPEQIPVAFRDIVIPLGDVPADVVTEKEPLEVAASEYKVVPRGKSKVYFDVVNSDGKVLNETVLSKDLANKMVKDLSK